MKPTPKLTDVQRAAANRGVKVRIVRLPTGDLPWRVQLTRGTSTAWSRYYATRAEALARAPGLVNLHFPPRKGGAPRGNRNASRANRLARSQREALDRALALFFNE